MIIRISGGDNCYTHIYKDFCIGGNYYIEKRDGFNLRDNLFMTGDLFTDLNKESRENRRRFIAPYRKWSENEPDYPILINELYRQWDIYAKDNNLDEWLRPTISVQNSIDEKDENGEVCYYFTAISQCLIM